MENKSFIKKFSHIWIYLGIILGIICIIISRIVSGYSNNKTSNIFFIISDFASVVGLFYVILNNAKLKIALYAGIIFDLVMAVVSFQQKIYLSTVYYLFYTFPSLVLGVICWNKNKKNELKVKMSKKSYIYLTLLFILAYALAVGFSYLVGSSAIFLDSATICLSGVGIYFLSRRDFLQWPVFILGDAFCIIEYTVLVTRSFTVLPLLVMVIFYLINDIIGLFNWLEDIKISKKKDIFYIITKNN